MIITDDFDGIYEGKNVEQELKQYLSMLKEYNNGIYFHPSKKIQSRLKVPHGYNTSTSKLTSEMRKYWTLQKSRIVHGYNDMSGIQYLYLNFYKPKGLPIRFRRWDNWKNTLIHKCIYGELDNVVDAALRMQFDFVNQADGVIELSRRRVGKSNIIGNAALHINMVFKEILQLLSSKKEEDAKNDILQDKIKFPYDKLPIPLKPDQLKASKSELYFGKSGKDANGNNVITGKNNQILAIGPTATGPEGKTIKAAFSDEAPKTKNFKDYFDYLLPALNDSEGFDRQGFYYVGGVAGDWGKNGDDFIDIWNNAKVHNMIKVFGPGWSSLECDRFGNEDIEAAVRKILTKRNEIISEKKISISKREDNLRKVQQQYPLTVEESMLVSGEGIFNKQLITEQRKFIKKLIYPIYTGRVSQDHIKRPVLLPGSEGNLQWLEPPVAGQKYLGGLDAYGVKETANTGSSGVCVVHKMENTVITPMEIEAIENEMVDIITAMRSPYEEVSEAKLKRFVQLTLMLGDLPVAILMDGPKDPVVFAEQAANLIEYYSMVSGEKVKVLGEKEPPIIYDWFLKNKRRLMQPAPLRAEFSRKDLQKSWVDMKGYWAQQRVRLGNNYLDNRISRVFWDDLLAKCLTYNPENKAKKHDKVDGWLLSLIMRADERVQKWNKVNDKIVKSRGLGLKFRRR